LDVHGRRPMVSSPHRHPRTVPVASSCTDRTTGRGTMNGFWGAGTEAVRAQGEACTGAAGTMETLLRSCSSLVSAAEWSGEDAEAFRERWVSEVDSRLQQVIEMLRADGEALRRHGDEQDEASSDDGGLGTGAPGAPIPTLPGLPCVAIATLR